MESLFKHKEAEPSVSLEDTLPGRVEELPSRFYDREFVDTEDHQEPELTHLDGEEDGGLDEQAAQSSNTIAVYLRDIGSVPLLTRKGEVELAKQVEDGESQVTEAVLSSPVALRTVLELGDKIKNDELNLHEVLADTDEGEDSLDLFTRQTNEILCQKRFLKEVGKLRRLRRNFGALDRKLV